MSSFRWRLAALSMALLLFACRETPVAPSGAVSRIDGGPLNALNMAAARLRGQLCSIVGARVGQSTIQVAVIGYAYLPFALPRVTPALTDGAAPARFAQQKLKLETPAGSYGTVVLSCIVPASFSDAEFRGAVVAGSNSDRWTDVIGQLGSSRPISVADWLARATREGREAMFEFVGAVDGTPGSTHVRAVGSGRGTGGIAPLDCTPAATLRAAGVAKVGDVGFDGCQSLPETTVTASRDPFADIKADLCEATMWCISTTAGGGGYNGGVSEPGGGGTPWTGTGEGTEETATWSKEAHDSLLNHGLRSTDCEKWTSTLSDVSQKQDTKHGFDNKRHYLRNPGQDPDAARVLSEIWIAQNLADAHRTFHENNLDSTYEYMGQALHTLMDKTSPAHVDENGMPYEYPGWPWNDPHHSPWDNVGDETTKAIKPNILDQNRNAMVAACSYVRSG